VDVDGGRGKRVVRECRGWSDVRRGEREWEAKQRKTRAGELK
jgi:hypothetical protein